MSDTPNTPPLPTFGMGTPEPAGGFPKAAVFGAIGAVVVVLLIVVFATRGHKAVPVGTILPLDAQAATLVFTDVAMKEATSFSGGKNTYIDGTVRNAGAKTVTGIELQVLFRNDEAMPPQVENLPLMLIRTREPYVDTQPVSAAPLAPGDTRDFRLIFEDINANWNVQIPEIHVVRVSTK